MLVAASSGDIRLERASRSPEGGHLSDLIFFSKFSKQRMWNLSLVLKNENEIYFLVLFPEILTYLELLKNTSD